MRFHHLGPAALALLAAWPALAQSPPNSELFARSAAGLAEGGRVFMANLGLGTVRRVTEGTFEIRFDSGPPATITFDEPVACLFTQETVIQGQPSTLVRFDLSRVDSLELGEQGQYEGLNAIVLQFNGPEDIVQIFGADGSMTSVPAVASIVTSLTIDDIGEAATALRQACPGP